MNEYLKRAYAEFLYCGTSFLLNRWHPDMSSDVKSVYYSYFHTGLATWESYAI
jgi:hypothetical protein